MMGKLLKMQMLEDEDDLAYETEKKQRSTSSSDAQPAWMRTLHTTARNWLQLIPEAVSPLKRTVENIKVRPEPRSLSSRVTRVALEAYIGSVRVRNIVTVNFECFKYCIMLKALYRK